MRPASRPLPLALLAAWALLPGCGGNTEPPPHVVLVLVDQLRADAVAGWMPEVTERASRGVVFEQMRAAAPWTYPSVISLFSGLYPQQHGADGHPREGRVLSTFDEHLPLLPGLLRTAGYHTAGFVTNPFLQTWNPFHLGFDRYAIEEFIGGQGNLRGFPGAVWRPETMFADVVNREVRAHFDARPLTDPEFTYVHYIDVHGPWEGAPFPGGYETAVRYVDAKIAELHDYFLERYDGRVLFLVTSDHGQELGDDLEVGEGAGWRKRKATVHDFNTHIPFIVLPSALVETPRVVTASCSNVDVLPTLLDWLGFDAPAGLPGRSLVPALRGEVDARLAGRAIYSRMSAFNRLNDCVVVDGRKLMRHLDPQSETVLTRTVFHLGADPRETEPLSEPFGEDGRRLVDAAETQGIEYPQRFEAPDQETLERLQALGYFGQEGGG